MFVNKILGLVTVVGLAATASSVSAQTAAQGPDQYLQVNLGSAVAGSTHATIGVSGVGSLSDNVDPKAGLFASLATGRTFGHGVALEVEAVYAGNDLDTSSLDALVDTSVKASQQTYGGLVNLIYNAPPIVGLTPYAGLGIGYGGVNYKLLGLSESDSGAIWQAKVGATYAVSPKITLDLGYRYLATPQFKFTQTGVIDGLATTASIKLHTELDVVSLGARYRF